MKKMNRFIAWIALLALLMSSFAFGEENMHEEALAALDAVAEATIPEEMTEEEAAAEETALEDAFAQEDISIEEVAAEEEASIEEIPEEDLVEESIVFAACKHSYRSNRDNQDGTHTNYCKNCNADLAVVEHVFEYGWCVCGATNGKCEHQYKNGIDLGNGKHSLSCSYCHLELGEEEHCKRFLTICFPPKGLDSITCIFCSRGL